MPLRRLADPLVPDENVVQLGERESRETDFAWPDVNETAITRIDVFEANRIGPDAVVTRIRQTIDRDLSRRFWIHLDVDVLDQAVMPAVDSPGSPGVEIEDLMAILSELLRSRRCCGMTLTVFDPDLDPDGRCVG